MATQSVTLLILALMMTQLLILLSAHTKKLEYTWADRAVHPIGAPVKGTGYVPIRGVGQTGYGAKGEAWPALVKPAGRQHVIGQRQ